MTKPFGRGEGAQQQSARGQALGERDDSLRSQCAKDGASVRRGQGGEEARKVFVGGDNKAFFCTKTRKRRRRQTEQGKVQGTRCLPRVLGDLFGKGVGGIDDRDDLVVLQPLLQSFRAAEAAATHLDGGIRSARRAGGTCQRIDDSDGEVSFIEPRLERVRTAPREGASAQDEQRRQGAADLREKPLSARAPAFVVPCFKGGGAKISPSAA